MSRKLWAVVPFKGAPSGKSRLAEHLDSCERKNLAIAMLRDVLSALCDAPSIDGVLLASRALEARQFTVLPKLQIFEEQATNLADAVTEASTYLSLEHDAETVFIVPGDVPLISVEDVSHATAEHRDVTLLPDERDVGTNGVISTPPNNFTYVFDGKSFQPHLENARKEGYQPRIVRLASFAHDIDTVDDLETVQRLAPKSHTAQFLKNSRILTRFGNGEGTT